MVIAEFFDGWGGWMLDQLIGVLKDALAWFIDFVVSLTVPLLKAAVELIHTYLPPSWKSGITTLLTYGSYIEIWFPFQFALTMLGIYFTVLVALFAVHKLRQLF